MKLTRPQKKFLKKNIKRLSLTKIAQELEIPEGELLDYLKSIWSKEKYQKFLAKEEHLGENTSEVAKQSASWRNFLQGGIKKGFNLKTWLSQNKLTILFLAFLVFAVYTNSLGNDFVSDDIPAIVENKNIGNFSFFLRHQPLNSLRYFFYFLAYKIGGLNPIFYRLLGILFHLGSVLVIYCLIYLLYDSFLALTVASLFAVHPILSEAVVWISGNTHAQYSFFVLLSLLLYLISRFHNQPKKYYLFSVISFLLALLTTEKAMILPAIILTFELSFGQLSKTWKKLIPFFSLSAIWIFSILFSGLLGQRTIALKSQHYQEGGFYNPLIQVPTAISSYLRLIFWPDKLSLYHSEMSFSQGQYLIMSLITLSFLGIIIYAFINKKYRQYFFWLSFFIIALLPMLTPFKVAWVVAERYVYLGSLGIFVVVAIAIQKLGTLLSKDTSGVAKRQAKGTPRMVTRRGSSEVEELASKASYILLGIILLALSFRTIIRNVDWRNQDTLWLAAAKTSPSSPQNHNNLGDYYGRQGDFQRSIEEFKKAIELNPGYADAYHNLGNTYQQIGETDKATENYQKAIELNPNLWQSYQNLAAIYFNQEKYGLALEQLEKAIQVNPQNSNLYTNLGLVYLKLNDPQNAQNALNTALQLDPENHQAKEILLYEIR